MLQHVDCLDQALAEIRAQSSRGGEQNDCHSSDEEQRLAARRIIDLRWCGRAHKPARADHAVVGTLNGAALKGFEITPDTTLTPRDVFRDCQALRSHRLTGPFRVVERASKDPTFSIIDCKDPAVR